MPDLTISRQHTGLSLKRQTLAAAIAVVGAVVLPEIFHAVGAVAGLGTALGETFLPMQLPIILVGLLAGPLAGAVAGAVSPLISFGISGMPPVVVLPFMMVELAVYGLLAGLLKDVKLPSLLKVLLVQVGGRVGRFLAVAVAMFGFGSQTLQLASVWQATVTGLPGIILQLCLLPLLVFWVNNRRQDER